MQKSEAMMMYNPDTLTMIMHSTRPEYSPSRVSSQRPVSRTPTAATATTATATTASAALSSYNTVKNGTSRFSAKEILHTTDGSENLHRKADHEKMMREYLQEDDEEDYYNNNDDSLSTGAVEKGGQELDFVGLAVDAQKFASPTALRALNSDSPQSSRSHSGVAVISAVSPTATESNTFNKSNGLYSQRSFVNYVPLYANSQQKERQFQSEQRPEQTEQSVQDETQKRRVPTQRPHTATLRKKVSSSSHYNSQQQQQALAFQAVSNPVPSGASASSSNFFFSNKLQGTDPSPRAQSSVAVKNNNIRQEVDELLLKIENRRQQRSTLQQYGERPSSAQLKGGVTRPQTAVRRIIGLPNNLARGSAITLEGKTIKRDDNFSRCDSPQSRLEKMAENLLVRQVGIEQTKSKPMSDQMLQNSDKVQTTHILNLRGAATKPPIHSQASAGKKIILLKRTANQNDVAPQITLLAAKSERNMLPATQIVATAATRKSFAARPLTGNAYRPTARERALLLAQQNLHTRQQQQLVVDGTAAGNKEMERYQLGVVIGKGSYAVVRLATDTLTNKKVAIKIYDKYRLIDATRRQNVKREIEILQRLEHPHIIRLHANVDTRSTLNLVMEYIGSDSLRTFIKAQPSRHILEREATVIYAKIVSAVAYCHEYNVIHRDIKLENILFDPQSSTLKLIDFGFAVKTAAADKRLQVFCGTPSYMAPEIVKKQEYLGKPADVWSLGILLYVMLYGRFPFKGRDDQDLYRQIQKNEFKLPSVISRGARDLLTRILQARPEQRPTCKQILEDSWFEGQGKILNKFQQPIF